MSHTTSLDLPAVVAAVSARRPIVALVRYGTVPEVARCDASVLDQFGRGDYVVIRTARGEQVGEVLQALRPNREPLASHLPPSEQTVPPFDVQRLATAEDLEKYAAHRSRSETEFPHWQRRIGEWELDIQIVDVEYTLEGNCILYVLNERGPDCTKLALRAAAAGLGIVAVQPVSAEGLVTLPASVSTNPSRCGSSGGSCGCH